jgi:methionyl-tRNA formyltransferase
MPRDASYVIATNRSWNRDLAERLRERTGARFELIGRREELTRTRLEDLRPRYVFFPHWSYVIPAEIHTRFECVIFHMTDVPFGRGGSPLQNLIARGLEATKISALRCVEELDAGPVYLRRDLCLHGAAEEIYLRASRVIEEMIVEMIETEPQPTLQSGEPVTFRRRRPEEGSLDGLQTLADVFDRIRMLDATGYPPAFLEVGPLRLEFNRASLRTDHVQADVRITLSPHVRNRSDDPEA